MSCLGSNIFLTTNSFCLADVYDIGLALLEKPLPLLGNPKVVWKFRRWSISWLQGFFFPDKKKVSKVCMYNDMAIRRKNSGWLRRKKRNFYFLTISFSLDFLMLQPALPILYHGELSAMNIEVFILLRSIIIMYELCGRGLEKLFFCLHRHWAWTRSQGGTNVKKSHYFAFATNLLFLSPLRQYIACGARKRKPKKIQKGKKHFCSRWPSLIYNLNIYHGPYFGITPRCTYLLLDVW